MKAKISAVEWLEEQIRKEEYEEDIDWDGLFKQAKQMEKEQIIEAYNEGQNTPYEYSESNDVNWYDGNRYYNETFKSE